MYNYFLKPQTRIHCLILLSGLAALSWEIVWQIKSTLSLGVSAWGAALTLAVTMGGMSIGALVTGYILKNKKIIFPVRIYGVLECIIGISGLFLVTAFQIVENFDTKIYGLMPDKAPFIHILGIVAVLGIPTFCLGATIPIIGLIAQKYKTPLAALYGLNTLGAAAGALMAAFLLIPLLGVTQTIWLISGINILVGITAILMDREKIEHIEKKQKTKVKTAYKLKPSAEFLIVFVTGFSMFILEIAWFRSLTAAFMSTTDAFAIMLSSVLLALGIGARLVGLFKIKQIELSTIICWAGILILLATPLVERFDFVTNTVSQNPKFLLLEWFIMTSYVIGPSVLLLGVALPWILEEQKSTRKWGLLYSFNTFAAIVGSVAAGWFLLPNIGFAPTAWLAGLLVLFTGLLICKKEKLLKLATIGAVALLIAVVFESGVGKTRVQGAFADQKSKPSKILKSYEGPDATISAVEYKNGMRMLIIDGFVATMQAGGNEEILSAHYMPWMGHMPMLLHPDPKNALVICFGTGKTANAVRKENPISIDVVDINDRVFDLAPIFTSNEDVLNDPRVKATAMDGRAFIRRTNKIYDVITLEPMPPNFVGVNALYSQEFYKEARKKMSAQGVIAQWVPFHLVPTDYSASIAKTFQSVFPNAILWIDPPSTTGILLGSKDDSKILGNELPGYARAGIIRDLTEQQVKDAILLNRSDMERYSSFGKIINDDNQLLSYGRAVYQSHRIGNLNKGNFELLKKITNKTIKQEIDFKTK